jgi:sugar lactone lactonase YvrE
LIFGNGMQRVGEHLLAMDSALGLALDIDPATGDSAVWLRHPLLAPDSHDFISGANGIAVQGECVYISNTARALLLRCSTAARKVIVVAENLTADDFALHSDGRIFLATHHGNSVLQLSPDGTRVELVGRTQGLAGSTAVALDPHNPDVLYVTATGGMRGLHDRGGQPARLMRLGLGPQPRLASDGVA